MRRSRIAVDAMGGDGAPATEIEAVKAVINEAASSDLDIILVGDEARLRDQVPEQVRIHHASQVITMDDAPGAAARTKRDASMRVCFDLVRSGEADAVVSAGNSGAMLACSLLVLKRLPGVERPGIVTSFPTLKGPCVLCDMGANVDVKPEVLAQFGVLGAVYAQLICGQKRPRVGLLSNGEEEHKGTELTRAAHRLLGRIAAAATDELEYLGYIEGRDIFSGEVDVVATDGFTGNVVLKTSEGAVHAVLSLLKNALLSSTRTKLAAVLAAPALKQLKRQIDYAEIGGAPLVGVDGVVVVCHGASPPSAIKNAIHAAARYVREGLPDKARTAIARHATLWAAAAAPAS